MLPKEILLAGFLAVLQLSNRAQATMSFGCRNSLIADEWREKVVNIHNQNRANLAKGLQKGSGDATLPFAKNMNQLTWDCNIEEMAQKAAVTCPTVPAVPAAPAVADNYGSANEKMAVGEQCNVVAKTTTTIQKWWDDGAAKQADQMSILDNKIFAQMAYQKTNAFACTYQTCATDLYLLCFYNQDGAAGAPKALYENVAAAQMCKGCGAGIDCVNGLCQPKFTLADDLNPQCAGAEKKLMTNDLRDMALNMNNYYRRILATGWAKDAKGAGGLAPRAKRMPQLKYDCATEDTIMAHLKLCAGTAKDGIAGTEANFKNLNALISREDALQQTVTEWWKALEDEGVENNIFKNAMKGTNLGNYANMAYDKATEVGCGVQTCTAAGTTLVQCNYKAAPALAEDSPIYEAGAPCECVAPATCSPLGGLCVTA